MLVLTLLLGLATAPPADLVAPGRKALLSLEYERALKLLSPVADDDELPRPVRAEAFVLIAQAHFGIAAPQAEDRARAALRSAFRLDRSVELQDREDLSPKLVALFDEMRPKKPTEKPQTEKPEKPPPEKPPPEKPPPEKPPPEKPPETPETPQAGPSPWLIGAGVGAGVAVVAVGAAVGAELYLGGIPPGTSADQVKSVQALGGAAIVVAVVALGAAGVAGVVGLVTAE